MTPTTRLYLGGNSNDVLGWVNTRVFLETGSSEQAQGWTPFVLDTNETGCATPTSSPTRSIRQWTRIDRGMYGISADPSDRTSSGDRMRASAAGS